MSRPPLPLTALRTFEVAARLLSFKEAAVELHVTPTAVSHQIQLLERTLGVELFIRAHRQLMLTPAALSCLPHVQSGFESLRLAVKTVRQHRDTGLLTVSAPPSFATKLLMPLMHEFMAAHPDIDLRITTRMREPLLSAARPQDEAATFRQWAEENDIIIILGRDGFGDLDVEQLLPLSIELVCSPELLNKGLEHIAHVSRFPWLHDDRGLKYGGSSFWAQWLTHTGLPLQDQGEGAHYIHSAVAIDAAARGHGLLVTTPCLCQKELREGTLVSPFAHRIAIGNSYFLLHRPTHRPTVAIFKRWLLEAMRKVETGTLG